MRDVHAMTNCRLQLPWRGQILESDACEGTLGQNQLSVPVAHPLGPIPSIVPFRLTSFLVYFVFMENYIYIVDKTTLQIL